jgi:anaerobic magnesium-protoporphyrin IX monomethyl ester cyclase
VRILIINPPYAASEPAQLPIGLSYICAVLEAAGHEVRVLDLLVSLCDRDRVVTAVEDFGPALVGTTSVTMNWPEASAILAWVKDADPRIATVAGGPHVTFTWEQIGREEPWIDYLVLGEGERTITELVAAMENGGAGGDIAGLAWREAGRMKTGPRRGFETDINVIPRPARHLFPLSRYRAMGTGVGVTTGRGCPFSCIFCVGPKMVGHKRRLRDPSAVGDEIQDLAAQGFRDISLSDDHFGMKRSHALAVCDEIISRGLDVELSAFLRADAAEPELLERMRRAGCSRILYGAESGVQEIVDRIRKKTDLTMLRDKVRMAREMGFQIQVSFILGLPGETPETVKQTLEYAYGLGVHAGVHVLAPLPGSELVERAEELGLRILHRDWRLYDANRVITETPGLSAGELGRIVAEQEENLDRLERMELQQWRQGQLSGLRLENVEQRQRVKFYCSLLKGGFFEGEESRVRVKDGEEPYDALVANAARRAGAEEPEAGRWLRRAMDAGDLRISSDGSSARFEFREDV